MGVGWAVIRKPSGACAPTLPQPNWCATQGGRGLCAPLDPEWSIFVLSAPTQARPPSSSRGFNFPGFLDAHTQSSCVLNTSLLFVLI